MDIQLEQPADAEAIRVVVTDAFARAPHRSGTEADLVEALRRANALTLSLVAREQGVLVGHVAFSPVTINGESTGWFGLGPVAVRPDRQRLGVGRALIQSGLDRLLARGAQGCVVLGDPAYYARFGFRSDPNLRYGDVPPEYLQRLCFGEQRPTGRVDYHRAFLES